MLGASRHPGRAPVAGRGQLARVIFLALGEGSAELAYSAHRVMTAALSPVAGVETGRAAIEVRAAATEEP